MSAWVIFRRARSLLFAFLVLGCLTWTTFFAIFLYHEWSFFSHLQKTVVIGLASLYVFTAILLYLMAVVIFRFWWEVARILALLVVHAGGAFLFMHYSPGFPCRGFGTESTCRKFVHMILVGCWLVSGFMLFFATILGIMAFVPRPVESLPESEEIEKPPLSPASFGAGNPMDEWRQVTSFYSIDSRTGLVTYTDKTVLQEASSPSPDRDSYLVSEAHQETITVGPLSTKDTPGDRASAVPRPQRVESSQSNPFRDPTSPPASIHSLASMNRTSVGRETSSISEDRPIRSPAFPEPVHRAISPIALRDSSSLVTTRRGRAAEDMPILSSVPNHTLLPAPVGGSAQPEQTAPDGAQAPTHSARSIHPFAASVHSQWTATTLHARPPPALTPGVALFRTQSVSSGLRNPSSAHNAQLGSKLGLKRQVSDPIRSVQRFGENAARLSHTPQIKEGLLPRRESDGQVFDRTQWQQLVLSAAKQ